MDAQEGAAQTLADSLGLSVEPKLSFERAVQIARGLKGGRQKLAKPLPWKGPIGQT